jgi:hypothetical protein
VRWILISIFSVGATYGSTFSIWDMSKLQGGKPSVTGVSFPEGGRQFRCAFSGCWVHNYLTVPHRWSHSMPDCFGITSQSPSKGAVIHIHDMRYIHAQPFVINIASKPHIIRDFDFVASRGTTIISAAVGRELVVLSVDVDS